ncbi:UDP-galactopyranose mutase [Prevotella denticola]|mgnify:FL=1|uniref:UDP-galactopyranose mutase n=1 Tax=Prevotella denticola TaxID=28129 RepID=UPI001BC834D5|nr:UDP-galactopyranose mutase [Prevotella denticola]QUI94670.1 UDP-galactopyranose mutase [Prevotella denticola]
MQEYDYLIVGAGLYGATFAHFARKQGKKCLVIDKRLQLGGNLYCECVEGINVHKYGAHIFHTNSKRVWDFVNSLVEFNRYTNSPVANYKGRLYNLPFNMNTFYQMWGVRTPAEAQAKLNEQRAKAIERIQAEHINEPRNLEEQALSLIGEDIYERLIKGYTEKQWGRKCTELPAFIIKRLPVRLVFDNNYFNDKYQGIPVGGYNKLIEALLNGVDTITDVDFFDCKHTFDHVSENHHVQGYNLDIQCNQLVFTGKIDEYFGYRLGKLDYRTVRFEHETLDMPNYQGNAVVNYTEVSVPYTRIIEHKHFDSFGQTVYENPKTVISREYSTEWQEGMEPYYPVNDDKNNQLAQRYRKLASNEPSVIFGGRLAEYKYYDMAPIVECVMGMFKVER